MLRPQDTATRETKRLDGRWPFVLDPDGVGRSEGWFAGPLKDARVMPVPASFNDIAADASVHDYVGDVWYQRVVRVPRGWDGQRIVLHFESATHRATVWVGSTEVVSHEGGYTPFEGDVSAQVVAGEEVRVTVMREQHACRSRPSRLASSRTRPRARQQYWHDFFNYAGLHRSVWLLGDSGGSP